MTARPRSFLALRYQELMNLNDKTLSRPQIMDAVARMREVSDQLQDFVNALETKRATFLMHYHSLNVPAPKPTPKPAPQPVTDDMII